MTDNDDFDSVTDTRVFSRKISQSRNTNTSKDPSVCHHCREPFAAGQMHYPIKNEVEWSNWALVSVCEECFNNTDDITECSFITRDRYERKCRGCGVPMMTSTVA